MTTTPAARPAILDLLAELNQALHMLAREHGRWWPMYMAASSVTAWPPGIGRSRVRLDAKRAFPLSPR